MSRALYGTRAGEEVQRGWLRTAEVPAAVYGLGKMGLPLAAVYAETTGNVTGVDIDESVVNAINAGECPVEREPGLPELVSSLVSRGALAATTDGPAAATDASLHVVIVPTLVADGEPDLSVVQSVARDVAAGLEAGDTVVFESTLPPGATEDVLVPLLAAESGLDPDAFGVAFCPERTSSGRALADVRGTHPKVVGGTDPEATRVAELVYGELVDNEVVPVSDARTAEAVKVFEGLYRDANIALANDLARLADDLAVDVREAVDAANTQPYCEIHTPGPGVGGHCIPYYPYFVLGWLDRDVPLVRTAREVNDAMPGFVVDRVAEGLAADQRAAADGGATADDTAAVDDLADTRVAVLGLTYRAGVKETRASPGVDICEQLAERGATVHAADPLVDVRKTTLSSSAVARETRSDSRDDETAEPSRTTQQNAERSEDADGIPAKDVAVEDLTVLDIDAAVVATDHDEFDAVDWHAFAPMVVVDGRDAVDLDSTDHRHYVVGRGWQ